jgi:hypothetical protein
MDVSAVWVGQTQTHAQGGGLARTVGANHAQTFTGRNLKRHIVHHGLVTIAFDQVLTFKKWGLHANILPVFEHLKSVQHSSKAPACLTRSLLPANT